MWRHPLAISVMTQLGVLAIVACLAVVSARAAEPAFLRVTFILIDGTALPAGLFPQPDLDACARTMNGIADAVPPSPLVAGVRVECLAAATGPGV